MPYEFREYPFELEPEASSSRSGGPPRESIGIDVLDRPGPPARPRGAFRFPSSQLMRGFAILVLAGIAIFTLLLFVLRH